MIIVIETLRHVREVLTDKNYKDNREILRAHLELSLKENPWAKHRQCSTKPSLTRKEIETNYGHRGVRFRSPSSQKLTQREETVGCEMCCWVSRACARGVEDFSGDSGEGLWGLRDTAFSGGLGRRLSLRCLCPLFSTRDFAEVGSLSLQTSKKESAVDVDHTVTRILSPEFVRADLPVILALQETRSWDVEQKCMYLDFLFMKTYLGSPLSLFRTACVMYREHGDLRRGARAVLFRFTMVMSVYAPDSVKRPQKI